MGIRDGSRAVLVVLQCFGNLRNGAYVGVFYGNSNNGLGRYRWDYAGRKSGCKPHSAASTRFARACPVN